MERRQMLAVVSSVGVTAIAGCNGSDDSNDESDGEETTNGEETTDGEETPSTEVEESSGIGDPIWSQINGNSGTRSASVTGLQSDDPSSYTIESNSDIENNYEPVITQDAIIAYNQIYNSADGSNMRQLAAFATRTPALVGDRVVMIAGSDVVAVNVESGEEEWRYTTASPASIITATEENAFVGTEAGMTALSMSDGERIWEKQNLGRLPRDENRGIAVVGDGVYITRLNEAYIFDTTDGSDIYTNTNRGSPIKAIFGPDGSIYEQRGTLLGSLVKLDSEGNVLWRIEGSSVPYAADEEYVYATTDPDSEEANSRILTAHNASDGSIEWSFEIPDGFVGAAAVGSDRVFILSGNRVFAVEKSSGERETIYSTEIFADSLALGDGLLAIVGGNDRQPQTRFLVE